MKIGGLWGMHYFYVGANASHACSKVTTVEAVAAIDNYKLRL
jgi:hypothetical protein